MEKEIVSNSLAEYVSSAEKLKNLLLTIYSESKNENRLTDDEKKKAAYALNMCTVSVSQIIDYKDLNILEQEYDAILNNINLEQMPKDEALLHILKQILDTITYFRIEEGEKKLVEKEYQQKMKNAIWAAVPNFGLIVAGGDPLTMAISLASQVGIGYMNYRRNKEEYNLDKERQLWRLQKSAIEQFNGLRRELFDTAWRLADAYDFPDEYRLTERQITQYNSILADTNELRKYERLEYIKDKFEAYPPFWYFIGNTASYIAGNHTLKIRETTRKLCKEKAKNYFSKYEELNKFNILREDKLVSTCALEHIDLLIEEENGTVKYSAKINELLKLAIESAGNSFDIIELCALTYLKLNKKKEAAELLRMLINEDYNTIINSQLLSSIYVYNYCNANNCVVKRDSIIADYELLSERVGIDCLFPLPEKGEDIKLLESSFGFRQKSILKSMFALFLQNLLQKYSIEWNKITSVFELGKDYPDSFFLDTDVARNKRKNEIKKVFLYSEKAEHYKERMANADYSFNLLRVLNSVYNTISKINYFGNNKNLLNTIESSIIKAINEYKEEINNLQDCMSDKKFSIVDYQTSQDISLERFFHDSMKILLDYANNRIDQIDNLTEITSIESELRSFCIKNGISEVSIMADDTTEITEIESEDRFYPSLLGHKTVVAKKNSDFVKEMTSFLKERMKSIVYENGKAVIYYSDEPGFDSYFYNERFNAFGTLKKHSIMIVTGGGDNDIDLIFTTDGIVTVINQEVKYKCDYKEIVKKKNTIELYNGYFRPYKYENDSLNMTQFYNLIQAIGGKFITNIEDKTDYIDEATPSELNKWFKVRNDAQGDNVIRAYAIADKKILKGLGYHFDNDLDSEKSLLQFYYEKHTGDLLGLRLVVFKNINSKFQECLIEKGVIRVK